MEHQRVVSELPPLTGLFSDLGQCLAGKEGEDNWLKHNAVQNNFCQSSRRNNCLDDDTHCIGEEGTLFGYQVVN